MAAASLAGVGAASLQLLLWPQVTPSLRRALLATLTWGSWSALWLGIGGFLLWALAVTAASLFGRPPRKPRLAPAMVASGAFVAAVAFFNQDASYETLPAAHRQALGVVGALGLLWAAAWFFTRRRRPVWLTVALVVLWIAGVWWPWWGAQGAVDKGAVPEGMQAPPWDLGTKPRRALVVVWEGADLAWLLPLADAGTMPFLQSLWPRGSWGQVRTVRPFSRAAALTTWATGCAPLRHGVVGRRAYRVPFLTGEPVSLLLRGPWPSPHQLPWRLWQRAAPPRPKEPTFWEALSGFGLRCTVAGWPFPTHLRGNLPEVPWEEGAPLDPGWEAAVEEALRGAAPKAGPTRRAFSLAAETGLRAALALRQQKPQVLVVHLDLPARLRPLWSGEDPGGVLPLAAQFLDSQLADLWALFGGNDGYVLLVSPYGMAPPRPWDRLLANVGLAGQWPVSPKDSPDGFFFLSGPGVAAGSRMRGARAADLVPTLFYLLELPVARELSGRVLLAAVDEGWASSVPLRLVPVYPRPQP